MLTRIRSTLSRHWPATKATDRSDEPRDDALHAEGFHDLSQAPTAVRGKSAADHGPLAVAEVLELGNRRRVRCFRMTDRSGLNQAGLRKLRDLFPPTSLLVHLGTSLPAVATADLHRWLPELNELVLCGDASVLDQWLPRDSNQNDFEEWIGRQPKVRVTRVTQLTAAIYSLLVLTESSRRDGSRLAAAAMLVPEDLELDAVQEAFAAAEQLVADESHDLRYC